jgi:hypothetical protein
MRLAVFAAPSAYPSLRVVAQPSLWQRELYLRGGSQCCRGNFPNGFETTSATALGGGKFVT